MGIPAERTPTEREASRALAHEMWNAVADDTEVESALSDLQTFGLVCEVRDLEAELDIEKAENRRLLTRVAELHQAMIRVSNETPFADEAKDALAQRGVLVAEVGTLKARVLELEEIHADLTGELEIANADKAEMQRILDSINDDINGWINR